ncbi:DUF6615 family protein [Nitrosomonas oligotropha]|uniref:DUF6615 family protein n=1 Tax=Nitrosomonas oligotropha TaxID=42354 RepID=UPI00136B9B43|nr:DUF6615 family protein [Nitrosomonas oligotropha]MXS83743.1 hypothetical protein [Nitrosomonas oligotropha]
MKNCNFCSATKAISLDVKNFMENVPDVKEESITDYLVWRWRELDKRFKYINISLFTRQQEATTGADFELELWLIEENFHLPLIFQAKKFIKQHDSYFAKLNYPDKTQRQLEKLLSHAQTNRKVPFYVFYSIPDTETRRISCRSTICCGNLSNTAVFIANANKVKEFADGKYGKQVSKNKLLEISKPFHCMFCCSPIQSITKFSHYLPLLFSGVKPHKNEQKGQQQLPEYVRMLLDHNISEINKEEILNVIDRNKLRVFRVIGVYDMRPASKIGTA